MTIERAALPFAVEVSSLNDEAVLTMRGELDLWTQSRFAAALDSVEGSFARIVLDLADLTFIDAGSLGMIYRARSVARLQGGELVLRSPSPHVRRILELTGLVLGTSIDEEPRPIVLPLPSRAYDRAAL